MEDFINPMVYMNRLRKKSAGKKTDRFKKFGIWCSGASWEALEECPTDWNKFSFNGYIIFLTAALALLSGIYFLSFVFPEAHITVHVLFGFLWAFLIFTLDRIIVVSMKKNGGIWKQLVQGGLLRLILAIFIGLVIATPLELRLFQNEIQAKIEINDQRTKNQLQAEQSENNEAIYISIRKKYNLDRLEDDENDKRKTYQELDKQRLAEAEGTEGTGKRGKGPVYLEKQESFNIAKANWENADKALTNATEKYNEEIYRLRSMHGSFVGISQETNNFTDGPEARIKALYQLSGLHWFITILFILIECLPVITKLMTPRSPYDETLDRIEHEKTVEQKEIISLKNSEINEAMKRADETAKLYGDKVIKLARDKADIEINTKKEILEEIAKRQLEIAKMEIDHWYGAEKETIKAKYNENNTDIS